jgi:hypothetical protein
LTVKSTISRIRLPAPARRVNASKSPDPYFFTRTLYRCLPLSSFIVLGCNHDLLVEHLATPNALRSQVHGTHMYVSVSMRYSHARRQGTGSGPNVFTLTIPLFLFQLALKQISFRQLEKSYYNRCEMEIRLTPPIISITFPCFPLTRTPTPTRRLLHWGKLPEDMVLAGK